MRGIWIKVWLRGRMGRLGIEEGDALRDTAYRGSDGGLKSALDFGSKIDHSIPATVISMKARICM